MLLYDYPQYYEIALSFRDIESETDFLCDCMKKFSRIPVRRVFEVACGPSPHASALITRKFEYVGLDKNRNMLDYASYKWHHLKPAPVFVEGDMIDFELQQPVDFAFVMLGSLYLNSFAEMTSHFNSIAKALRPGGLYFLDWCIQFTDPLTRHTANTINLESAGVKVESRFNTKLVDPAQQMYEEVWTVNVDDNGRHKTFEMIERNRAVFPQEFLLFLENRTDFEFVGWWREWDLNKPISGPAETNRPVALIRRK